MLYDIMMIIVRYTTKAGLLLICIIMLLRLWTRFPLSSGTDTGGSGFASVLLRYPSTIWLQWTRQQPTVTHLVQFILKRCPVVFWDTSGAVLMISEPNVAYCVDIICLLATFHLRRWRGRRRSYSTQQGLKTGDCSSSVWGPFGPSPGVFVPD